MRTIRVVAAVIRDGDRIFATARGYGEYKGGWEFPGGKIEPGETAREALAREIREELDTEICVGELIDTIEYDYPSFHLSMDCFWCTVREGKLTLREAEAARWLTAETIDSVDWLPADRGLIGKIQREICGGLRKGASFGIAGTFSLFHSANRSSSVTTLVKTPLYSFLVRP